MKTTVDLPDRLLEDAKEMASKQKTTIRALLEEGLRAVLKARSRPRPFKLRRATFLGQGLNPDVREGSWESLRDAIYEGRGA